jgi:hypothetical protein
VKMMGRCGLCILKLKYHRAAFRMGAVFYFLCGV